MRTKMPPKRKRSSEDSLPARGSKRAKTIFQKYNPIIPTASASTVPSESLLATTETTTRTTNQNVKRPVYLVPIDRVRRLAVLGQRDDSVLRLQCMNLRRNKVQEQKFKKIPYNQIQ